MKLLSNLAAALVAVGALTVIVGCGDDTNDATTTLGAGGAGGDAEGGAPGVGGGSDGGGGAGEGGNGQGGMLGSNPHPLYPPLDLDALPGDGGSERGPYTPPTLPSTSNTVTVTTTGTQAGSDLIAACDTPGTEVTVPSAAGNIGVVNFGNVDDCDVVLGDDVVVDYLLIGSVPGPTHAPTHRLRIRGGQMGSVFVRYGSSDLVLDGVTINNGVVPSGQRPGTGLNFNDTDGDGDDSVVNRFALINSVIRLVAVDGGGGALDGTAQLGRRGRNMLFANNNIVTAGNRNSWGFRFSGGENILLVDNTVRVSFHKLVRMNDAPVEYLYIAGGTWMREATESHGGGFNNDSFAQLSGSTTDKIYVHDLDVYLMANTRASFGATADAVQSGRSWEARNITWHAVADTAMSAAQLTDVEGYCTSVGGLCDYGVDTHTFEYDANLELPTDAWRNLPNVAESDPDALVVVP